MPLFDRAWDELGAEEQALCHVVRRVRQRERADLAMAGLARR